MTIGGAMPAVAGVQGTYGLAGDGLRGMHAGGAIGDMGASARAISADWKNAKNVATVDDIWRAHAWRNLPRPSARPNLRLCGWNWNT